MTSSRRSDGGTTGRRRLARLLAVGAFTLALVATADVAPASATNSVLYSEPFSGPTVTSNDSLPAPQAGYGQNHGCLTAGTNQAAEPIPDCDGPTPDATGNGALQLTNRNLVNTSTVTGEEGGAFYDSSVPTGEGLDISFESYQFDTSTAKPADGISFALAAGSPSDPGPPADLGSPGGNLGYSGEAGSHSHNVNLDPGQGLTNGYLGVGLDVFGNFSNPFYDGGNPTLAASATLSGALTDGNAYTTLSVDALADQFTSGDSLVLYNSSGDSQTVTVAVTAPAASTSITVGSFTANANYLTGSSVEDVGPSQEGYPGGSTAALDTCADPSWAPPGPTAGHQQGTPAPEQVTVRGPGEGQTDYCLLNSSLNTTNVPEANGGGADVATDNGLSITSSGYASDESLDSPGLPSDNGPDTVSATLTAALTSGNSVSSLSVSALPEAVTSGDSIVVSSGDDSQAFTVSGSVAAGGTSIPVTAVDANFSYPVDSVVQDSSWHILPGLTSGLTSGNSVSSLAVSALPEAVTSGDSIVVSTGSVSQTFTASASVPAAAGPTSIPVTPITASSDFAIATEVYDLSSWNLDRSWAGVPVEVAINPTASQVTTIGENGLAPVQVGPLDYTVTWMPHSINGSTPTQQYIQGKLPTVSNGLLSPTLYTGADTSWFYSPTANGGVGENCASVNGATLQNLATTCPNAIPQQLNFGWTASTGADTEIHEVALTQVSSLTGTSPPVYELTDTDNNSGNDYSDDSTYNYIFTPSLNPSDGNEPDESYLTATFAPGLEITGTPTGTGWTNCQYSNAPSGSTMQCDYNNQSEGDQLAAGSSEPAVTVPMEVTDSAILPIGSNGVPTRPLSFGTVSSFDGTPASASDPGRGPLPSTSPPPVVLQVNSPIANSDARYYYGPSSPAPGSCGTPSNCSSPASGPASGGNPVIITGDYFTGATGVDLTQTWDDGTNDTGDDLATTIDGLGSPPTSSWSGFGTTYSSLPACGAGTPSDCFIVDSDTQITVYPPSNTPGGTGDPNPGNAGNGGSGVDDGPLMPANLTTALTTTPNTTSLAVNSLPYPVSSGDSIVVTSGSNTQAFVASAAAAAGAGSVSVDSQAANFAYPVGSTVEDSAWFGPTASPTVSTALTSGNSVSSLTVTALSYPINSGDSIVVTYGSNSQTFTAGADVAANATSIPVTTANANFSYPVGSTVEDAGWIAPLGVTVIGPGGTTIPTNECATGCSATPDASYYPVEYQYVPGPAYTPTPAATLVTPLGPASAGNPVQITGQYLEAATSVTFTPGGPDPTGSTETISSICPGGGPFTDCFVINSPDSITVYPTADTGTAAVSVFTPSPGAPASNAATGGTNQPAYYTFISAVGSGIGPTTGGTPTTITGVGLSGTTAVFYNGTPLSGVCPGGGPFVNCYVINTGAPAVSATTVTAYSPAGTGQVPITMEVSDWLLSPGTFTYISAVGSGTGPTTGGTPTTITGAGLLGTTSVSFNGTALGGVCPGAGPFVNCYVITPGGLNGTTVTAYSPPGAVGVVPITMEVSGFTLSPGTFTYTAGTPATPTPFKPPGHKVPVVTRIGGPDRDTTAVDIAETLFPTPHTCPVVVLARDDIAADGLAGAPLAQDLGGVILLTNTNYLTPVTNAAIQQLLEPGGQVFVLGQTAAITQSTEDTVANEGYDVTRIGGIDRFATATLVANKILAGGNPDDVFLATGQGFADAVEASGAATATGGVVIFTNNGVMPAVSEQWLQSQPNPDLIAIGGPAASADPSAPSLVGSDSQETASLVAGKYWPSPSGLVLATNATFPDALAGSVLASHEKQPLLLVSPTEPAPGPDESTYLTGSADDIGTVQILGGIDAVPDSAVQPVLNLIGDDSWAGTPSSSTGTS